MRRLPLLAALAAALLAPGAAQAAPRAASVFYVRGAGFGHGVGMSQYGAYGYALHGASYAAILAHYYSGTALGTVDPNQIVTVLLKTGTAAFSGADSDGLGKKLNPSLTYTLALQPNGSLRLLDPAGHPVGYYQQLTVTGPGPLTVPGLGSYRGALEFRPDGTGGVQTVDALGLDTYVSEVVAAEMPSSWPAQALEAQAVAARTYAITTSVQGNGYGLYSDTRSQMFGGIAAETPATDAAVAATRGQVVTLNGVPVATYFFSSSGGYTENNENVWAGTPDPWLRGVPDPYDDAAGNPYFRWGSALSLPTATAELGGLVRGSLIGIRVLKTGVSPRIVLAQVVGTGGTTTVSGAQLELAFGLQSTWATFTTITTRGGPRLSGAVFPGHRGQLFAVQVLGRGGWRTVRRARLGPGGSYAVRVPRRGRYRIAFRGLDGPAVVVA